MLTHEEIKSWETRFLKRDNSHRMTSSDTEAINERRLKEIIRSSIIICEHDLGLTANRARVRDKLKEALFWLEE